ncbi:MAG: hypothetical protein GKR90_23125 [Pseudomonadales bacterium]|nr:hypothetical protein [Pseudomonadales bacterium]
MTKAAGPFDDWLVATDTVLRTNGTADVPCGTCNACCRSGQFIQVTPADTSALAVIDPQLLFPAPGKPEIMILGFDEKGHCPLLKDDHCSIYDSRPQACRTYDCRVFAAAQIDPDDQPLIKDAISDWEFAEPNTKQIAVSRAARYIRKHSPRLGSHHGSSAIQLSLSAIKIHDLFLENGAPDFHQVRSRLS